MQAEKDTLENTVFDIELEIKNTDGLHMRPAMQFVDIANRFESEINVSNGETNVDGKSIMQISMLAATCGTKLKVTAKGPDARQAIDALKELVEDKHFGEPTPEK
ncbi:MAG: HPr family phosphocarrier protein [Sedimentisphaerales bacterium]|nr:HPr family phosphocarrier protein [Sedimentisphaerales bacterium]